MKVILSRKGFDSQYGRVPSPILPDGRMISLPIPDKGAPVSYRSINRDGINLGTMVTDLGAKRGNPTKPISVDDKAHLDPDLDADAVPRPHGWRPIFGQESSACGHLRNQGVGAGDLFLFFGWFRPALKAGESRWRYDVNKPPVHALWGWLRIGEMHPCPPPASIVAWASGHPHLHGPPRTGNTVFVAAEDVIIGGRRLPGAGIFSSMPERVLSDCNHSLSNWRLPAWMHPSHGMARLSYNVNHARWTTIDHHHCRLLSAGKGQEFVLTANDLELQDTWLARLFSDVGVLE